jgi:DNA-binding FadR family transcriptional regulator
LTKSCQPRYRGQPAVLPVVGLGRVAKNGHEEIALSTNPQTRVLLTAGAGGTPADAAGGVSLETIPTILKEQLYAKISRAIIEQIRTGQLAPGQRLPPGRDLAKAFGVSRPSLREALGALQMLGVVETRHGSGSWITARALEVLKTPPDESLDLGVSPLTLLEARALLEPAIASLAAERFTADPEIDRLLGLMTEARDWENPAHRAAWSDGDRLFHLRLAVHSQNPVYVSSAQFIADVQAQPLWWSLGDDTLAVAGRIALAIEEHGRIFEAVRSGDSEAAAKAASEHLEAVRDSMGLD